MGILNAAVTCRTSLLPNTIKDRDQVGNWQPITIGNLLMRIYGRIWVKDYGRKLNWTADKKDFTCRRLFWQCKYSQEHCKSTEEEKSLPNSIFGSCQSLQYSHSWINLKGFTEKRSSNRSNKKCYRDVQRGSDCYLSWRQVHKTDQYQGSC